MHTSVSLYHVNIFQPFILRIVHFYIDFTHFDIAIQPHFITIFSNETLNFLMSKIIRHFFHKSFLNCLKNSFLLYINNQIYQKNFFKKPIDSIAPTHNKMNLVKQSKRF